MRLGAFSPRSHFETSPVVTPMSQAQAQQGQGVFGIPGEWIKAPEHVVALALFLATQPAVGPTAQSFSLMRRDT